MTMSSLKERAACPKCGSLRHGSCVVEPELTLKQKRQLAESFRPGQKVVLARVRNENFRGKTGVVDKARVSTHIVTVILDEPPSDRLDDRTYGSFAWNLDPA
jgi:hypothetical protein